MNCNNTNNDIKEYSLAMLGSSPPSIHAVLDTGTTGNYFSVNAPLQNIRPDPNPILVEQPDSSIITSTHIGDLPIPSLPPPAQIAHVIPALGDTLLILVGLLCDNGCEA